MPGFDFMKLLGDPNFQQYLGNTGAKISSGKYEVGEALNPSQYIENVQAQNATEELLRRILSQATPTPQGQAGPDKTTVTSTADGHKITMDVPSEKNLNSFGTNVPLESQPIKSQVQAGDSGVPFLRALLSQ